MKDARELPKREIVSRRGQRGFELAPEVLNDTSSVISFLRTRRSAEPALIGPPGPDAEQLALILECASRTPDHGKLEPWRFIVVQGEGLAAFRAAAEARWQALHPGEEPDRASMLDLLARVPVLIFVIDGAREHPKIPVWEQRLSVGAACMNMLAAATALDLAMQWRSGWLAGDEGIAALLGLSGEERVAAVMLLGSPRAGLAREDRRRPFWRDKTTWWSPPE